MSEEEPVAHGTSDVTSGRLLRNTLFNGLANVSSAAVTAILTPFLLRRLGAEEYGLWLLALGLTFSSGYLALADLGLSEAAVKFIAEARAKGKPGEVNAIASSTIAIFVVVAAIVGGAIAVISPALVRIFDVAPATAGASRTVFALLALEVLVELPGAGVRAVIEGAQRYVWLRSIDVLSRVGWGVAVVIAVSRGHGVTALAVASLAATLFKATAASVVAHRVQRGLQLRPQHVDWPTLRRTLAFGSSAGGLRILSVVYSQMDRAIVGVVVGVSAVALYEVAFRIQSISTLALVMASSAVLPAAAHNAARSDVAKQRELFLRGTKYAAAVALPITTSAILFAPQLIRTWIGEGYVGLTDETRLFLIYPLFACLNQVGTTMLIGLGRVRRVLLLQAIGVGTNLGVSLVLAPRMGIRGVIIGTLVGVMVVWLPYVRVLLQTFDVSVATWARRILLPNLPGLVLQAACGALAARTFTDVGGLAGVVGLCAAACGVNAATFVLFGLGADERRHLLTRVVGR